MYSGVGNWWEKNTICKDFKHILDPKSMICLVPRIPTLTTWEFNTKNNINQILRKDDEDFELEYVKPNEEEHPTRKPGYDSKFNYLSWV